MPTQELLLLKKIISEERKALLTGAVEEILKWANYKARIVAHLRGKPMTPEDQGLVTEILRENERNKRMVEAGLSFVAEAYNFLKNFLVEDETYRQATKTKEVGPKVFSKRA